MSTPTPPRRELLSTYVRRNRLTDEEIKGRQLYDHKVTLGLGGVLPEQLDPTRFRSVLDIGCGTGNWLIDLAQAYPMIPRLVGIDASTRIVESARVQAEAEHVSDRVEFRVMNALDFLDFPPDSFDLINMRFGSDFLRTWEWDGLLRGLKRIATTDAVVRIIEFDVVESSNPIVSQREEWVLNAFYQSGHYFKRERNGLTCELTSLLQKAEFYDIQTDICTLDYQAGGIDRELLGTYMSQGFWVILPFLQKWVRLSGDHEQLSQQLLHDLQQPDFAATQHILTVWGRCNPPENVNEIS